MLSEMKHPALKELPGSSFLKSEKSNGKLVRKTSETKDGGK